MNAPINRSELPSLRQLHIASAVSMVVAAVLAVAVVLPAETGTDPTGAGAVLGLTAMGELKTAGRAPKVPTEAPFTRQQSTIRLSFAPGASTEVKAVMREGDPLHFRWTAEGGPLYFDFHGEPRGAAPNVFTSFEKNTLSVSEQEWTAPFDGTHGWYWKNKGESTVVLELQVDGVYQAIGER